MNTFFKLLIFFLILIIGFAGLAFYWTFYKPLPDYEEIITLNGLNNEVDIHWDTYGVPHIYADTEEDLYFALGFVHAQDRLWQMTLSQIAAEGRFAEFFSDDSNDLIELDKYQRTLGFWRMAQQLEREVLNENERSVLESYSSGVNSFIENNTNRLPVEFSLSGVDPIHWNPTRTLAIGRLLGWELNISWWSEVTYGYLQSVLPPAQFAELQLRYPGEAPTTLDDTESMNLTSSLMPMLQQEINKRKLLQTEGTHVGSNAWVVDGSRTNSGFPLLAGDPHLGLDIPGKWYEVHLNLDGKNVSGATIPGAPVVVLGQNDQFSWTFTSIMSDDTDFFIEQVDPEDRGRFIADSLTDTTAVYESFTRKREIIKVKDGDDQPFEIRFTNHGPVISDIYPVEDLTKDKLITMRWTGYENSNEMRTLYQINWAENFQDFKDALPGYGVPGVNLLYGDVEGNIAMYSVGNIPIRTGDPISFRKGWALEEDWQGFIPHEEMPRLINPEQGWIANANNKLTTDSYPYYIATFWEPPSRIERIEEVLNANEVLTPEIFADLQNDTYSAFAAKLTPIILDIIEQQETYNFDLAVSYLDNWDFRYEKNSTAASIFDTFLLKLAENIFMDDFGENVFNSFINLENIPVRTLTNFVQNNSSFFDDINTAEIEDKEDIVLKSMQDALFFLSDSLGSEPFEWRWEQLHSLTLEPPFLSMAAKNPDASGTLKLIVNNILSRGPYPVPGHGMSINNGQYNWDYSFDMILGPSLRRIADLSNLSRTKSVMPTGQSGNPLSDHYGDQTNMWLDGQYRWLHQDSTLFMQADFKTMTLTPESN
ncbi:MAG: penicillin acylase family protein [Balneolaceae bacterium]